MDPVLIAIAFVFGFAGRLVGLPPLVGYLVAGFVLSAMGYEGGPTLDVVADTGIYILLFSIGLKLDVRTLARPHVWGTASLHAAITVAAVGGLLLIVAGLGPGPAFVMGFALSFSSTVFAVKMLEAKREESSLHGRTSIGILIVQDLFAVIFLAASAGALPSPWAIALLGLIPLRPVIHQIMQRVRHGELLVLFGLALALSLGVALFSALGVKPDLGALIVGVLAGGHPKAKELASSLLSLKDLLLVGFFLSIGLRGVPDLSSVGVAAVLILLLPVKQGLFFWLLARFRMRSRTAWISSATLATFSEFGLIVGYVAVNAGWVDGTWLTILAVAVSLSLVTAAPLAVRAQHLYARFAPVLLRFEVERRLPEDMPLHTGDAEILVFGMGRVGTAAYDVLRSRYGRLVLGVDFDARVVDQHVAAGRNVVRGDAADTDFWDRLCPESVRLVLLTLQSHAENSIAAKRIGEAQMPVRLSAITLHKDEAKELAALGVSETFDIFEEAGAAFADHSCAKLWNGGQKREE